MKRESKNFIDENKSLIAILIVLIFLPLLICIGSIAFYYISGPTYPRVKNEKTWIEIYRKNKEEFDSTAAAFLKQNEMAKIQMQESQNAYPCDKRTTEKCNPFALSAGKYNIYEDGYALDQKNSYVDFLNKYNIMFLWKNGPTGNQSNNVWFISGDFSACGLMYLEEDIDLQEDFDILKVTKIEDHWFYFCQDWN